MGKYYLLVPVHGVYEYFVNETSTRLRETLFIDDMIAKYEY